MPSTILPGQTNSVSRNYIDEWIVLTRAQLVLRIVNLFLALGIIVVMSMMFSLPGLWSALIPGEKISGMVYGVLLLITSVVPIGLAQHYHPKRRSNINMAVTFLDSFMLVFGCVLATILVIFYPMYTIIAATFALYVVSVAVTAAHLGLDIRQLRISQKS